MIAAADASLNALNVARLTVGMALGLLGARCAVIVLTESRKAWERYLFGALLVLIVGKILQFGEDWDRPLQLSGLPIAATACALMALGWWSRYRVRQ